jgi:hypothetical protein
MSRRDELKIKVLNKILELEALEELIDTIITTLENKIEYDREQMKFKWKEKS